MGRHHAWPPGAMGRVEVRATLVQGGQGDQVQPWLARHLLVICRPAMSNLSRPQQVVVFQFRVG